MAELGPPHDPEVESEFEYLISDIAHIITCLYKFSIAIRNPAPKDHLHKTAPIDISYFEALDIQQVDKVFCPVDPQNNFRVAKYLSERLGKANTRRRQLLRSYKARHKEAIAMDESLNDLKPVTSTMEGGSTRAPAKILDLKSAAVYHAMESQTAVPTTKTELSQAGEVEQDEDQFSQTSDGTSTNHTMRIHFPSPPTGNGGGPFKCPYCCNIIRVESHQDWKYVGNYVLSFYGILNIFHRRHVLRDLQPYVCTFLDCPKADVLYNSRREWFDHEVQLHRGGWYCDPCSETFSQKALFQEHIKVRHSEQVTTGNFEAVIRCEGRVVTNMGCPLCGIKFNFQTLEQHLGLHLQEVALFALPHHGEGISERKSEKGRYPSESSSDLTSFERMSSSKTRKRALGSLEVPFPHKRSRSSSPNPTSASSKTTPNTVIIHNTSRSLLWTSCSDDEEIAGSSTLAGPAHATGYQPPNPKFIPVECEVLEVKRSSPKKTRVED